MKPKQILSWTTPVIALAWYWWRSVEVKNLEKIPGYMEARAKGVNKEVALLVCELTELIRESQYSRYRMKENELFTVLIRNGKVESAISLRTSGGRRMFRQACLDELEEKAIALDEGEIDYFSRQSLLAELRPVPKFLSLLRKIYRIEHPKVLDAEAESESLPDFFLLLDK